MNRIFAFVLSSSSRKKLVSNFLSLSFIQGANYLIPLFILPYIVRIIGPEKFGLLSYSQFYISYFTIVVNYSFDYTATREISLNRDSSLKMSSIYSAVFFTKLFLFGVSTIIFSATIFSVDKFSKDWQLFYFTYLINVGFVFFPSWFFQGTENLTKTALFNFFTKLFFAALVILLIKEENDFLIYAFSNSVAQVTIGVAASFYVLHYYKIRIIWVDWRKIFATLKEGRSIFLSNVVISFYTTTNLMILGFYTTEKEFGYFSAALKIALVTHSLIVLPLGMTLFPFIGRKMHESETEGIRILLKYVKWISVFTLLIGSVIFFFAEDLIVLLFGIEFIEATLYLKIMAFIPFVSGLNNLISIQGLLNLRKDKEFFFITFATLGLSLVLNFILVPTYKGVGTAIIQLVLEIFSIFIASYYLIKVIAGKSKSELN